MRVHKIENVNKSKYILKIVFYDWTWLFQIPLLSLNLKA
jgi:hypothetical protein